jgi:hypothetical protein
VRTAGYRELLDWLGSFGEIERIGVESTGSYAAGLTRYLIGEGVAVIEVNQAHPPYSQAAGKTDAIDAELAARHVLAGHKPVLPKQTTGIVESIRQLRVARESAVKSRSAAMLQLGDLILTAPSELREQLAGAKTLRGKAASAGGYDQTTVVFRTRLTPPSWRCAASPGGSLCSTRRSPSSTPGSHLWSRTPPPGRRPCWGSPPGTPGSFC